MFEFFFKKNNLKFCFFLMLAVLGTTRERQQALATLLDILQNDGGEGIDVSVVCLLRCARQRH
jgi:hypothetical protein